MVLVHHSTKFQADNWNPLRVRAVISSLGPGASLFCKIWKFHGTRKKWLSMATFNSNLHHPTKFQADTRYLIELERYRGPPDLVKQTIMENFKGPWNMTNLAEHVHFQL